MPELVITDANWRDHAPDAHGHFQFDGHVRICNARRPSIPMASIGGVKLIDPAVLIPESEWDYHIARKDREQSWLHDLMVDANVPCKDQDGLGYCWAYGMTSCAEVIRLIAGHRFIELSPESLAGPIVQWRNEGGMPDWTIEGYPLGSGKYRGGLRDVGICRQEYAVRQSLKPSTWDPRWEADRQNFRCPEYTTFDVGTKTFQAVVTAAIMNIPLDAGFQWWLHAFIYGLRVRKVNGKYQVMARNSWGPNYGENGYFWLEGSRAVPDLDAIGPRVITPYDG